MKATIVHSPNKFPTPQNEITSGFAPLFAQSTFQPIKRGNYHLSDNSQHVRYFFIFFQFLELFSNFFLAF